MMPSLTPGDLGILGAVMDDAIRAGLGDDGIIERISWAVINEDMAQENEAWSVAYDFFIASSE